MKRSRVAVALAFAIVACSEMEPTAPENLATTPQFAAAPGFGTTTDLEELLGLPRSSLADNWENGFRQQVSAQFGNEPALERVLSRWLKTLVFARLNPANTDNELFLALSAFDSWLQAAEFVFPDAQTLFQQEIDLFDQVAATKLAQAIDGNLTVCRTDQSLGALANVIMWYEQAEVLALTGGPDWTLTDDDISAIIESNCVAVVVQSISFPNPVDVGQSFTLLTNTAIRFAGQTSTQPAAFQMDIGYNPPGIFLPSSFTDAAGHYETPLTFTTAGFITVSVFPCLVLPGRTEATIYVCGNGSETGNALNPPPPPPPPGNCSGTLTGPVAVVNVSTLNAVAGYAVIDGDLRIFANDSLVNVTFPCLRTVTGSLNITNNRALTQIAFPQLVEVGRFLSLILNPIVATAQFPALQQVGQVGSTPGTFPGAFAINSNPLLSTLDIGAVTIHRNAPVVFGGLQLMLPHSLTTLNGLSTGISVDTLFFTLPAAGQPGLTKAQFQAYKSSAPAVQQVCELPFGVSGARICL